MAYLSRRRSRRCMMQRARARTGIQVPIFTGGITLLNIWLFHIIARVRRLPLHKKKPKKKAAAKRFEFSVLSWWGFLSQKFLVGTPRTVQNPIRQVSSVSWTFQIIDKKRKIKKCSFFIGSTPEALRGATPNNKNPRITIFFIYVKKTLILFKTENQIIWKNYYYLLLPLLWH